MVHRRDLIDHFDWLAGSEYYEEVLDEALVAIALVAHGYDWELVEYGAAWRPASGTVEVLGLEDFVEKARADLVAFGRARGPARPR
jgi:hypothetical protein